MAMPEVGMDLPIKTIYGGPWFKSAGGICTTTQYFEESEVIIILYNSYWGGWMEPRVLPIKSHKTLTKLPGLASGVLRWILG
jgi:hypothetical protein